MGTPISFQTEFPDFPAADMPEIPPGFEDTSWHNDACPCFTSEELGLILWIDYTDPSKRELSAAARFLLVPIDDDIDTELVLRSSDDMADILGAIERRRAEVAARKA